jgi:hypothetical protein
MNVYNKALTANQLQAHSLDVNQHAKAHIRLAFIENFLFDNKRKNKNPWTKVPDITNALNQTPANVLRLVRILEKQGRIELDWDGNNGDGTGQMCWWACPITSK